MSTSTLSTDRTHYRELVAQVAAKAKSILPSTVNGRVESACKLVLNGDVEMLPDGTWRVGSSDPARWYHLVGQTCTCTDFVQQKAPEGWCKHRISAGIQKRVSELLQASPLPPTLPVSLPEAPASCNVYVTISGHKVQ